MPRKHLRSERATVRCRRLHGKTTVRQHKTNRVRAARHSPTWPATPALSAPGAQRTATGFVVGGAPSTSTTNPDPQNGSRGGGLLILGEGGGFVGGGDDLCAVLTDKAVASA